MEGTFWMIIGVLLITVGAAAVWSAYSDLQTKNERKQI